MDSHEGTRRKLGDMARWEDSADGIPTAVVDRANLLTALTLLKGEPQPAYDFLADHTAVDYPEGMVLVYHLLSMDSLAWLRLKAPLDKGNLSAPSAAALYRAAELLEREVYDLLGVVYQGHPDLRRLLCPDDFDGHPLRKDYDGERGGDGDAGSL